MNIAALFIQRPIGTTLLGIGLAIAGMVAYQLLPVAPLPQVDFPTISVTAMLPGGSPENMSTAVASPLERQLGHISGVTQMTSTSTLGLTRINLQFDLSRNIDGAARDVQAAINASLSQLPSNLPSLPTYRKVNPADSPILVMALTSDRFSKGELYDTASSILQQRLSQVSGVGQVIVTGSSLPAIRVELNPTALNNYGISLPDVAQAIAAQNVSYPKGHVNTDGTRMTEIATNDQIFKVYQYKPVIIAYRNNSPVRVSDVGEVIESTEDVRNAGLVNGKPAVIMVVFKQPGANVIETVVRVRHLMPQLQSSIPKGIDIIVTHDKTQTIRASLYDVELTLLIAVLLVIFVTYLFLGSVRAMTIPGIALPLSLLGTFGFMKLLGFTLDNLSLMALIISTGFVVDDAVVVLENITRHLERGKKAWRAALDGAAEVSFTVLSMSISLIVVFIPILFMGGLVGRLFREFALTLSIAILISMLVSLSVTPMMCSQLLQGRSTVSSSNKREVYWVERLLHYYRISLEWVLEHTILMLCILGLTLLLNIVLFMVVPKGFFPQQDTGQIVGIMQTDQDLSFQGGYKKLQQFVNMIRQDPAVAYVAAFMGGNFNTSPGSIYITLKPLSERDASADAILNRLRPQLDAVTGATLYMQATQDLQIGGRQSNAQFQYTLSGSNLKEVNEWSEKVKNKLISLPGIVDMNSDQRDHGLQIYVDIDRDTASRFGITANQIDTTLYSAFGQRQISTMYTTMNQYHVVMEVAPQYWQRPETLDDIYVVSPTGKEVPLSAFSRFKPSSTLLSVNHEGELPSATLSFNLLPGTSLQSAVDSINAMVADMNLPPHIHGAFQGTAQVFQASLADEPYLILAAVLAVYIILGMLYESLIHPITILSTLPSAGLGALLALLLSRTDFSIIALIGMILLIGIVKKNAIMMIDFAIDLERNHHKTPREAIYEAALLRFRPIMMTTMAALFGALPLVWGLGLGAELRQPLGITIVGGLLVSQLLTLYTTPVIYLTMDKIPVKLRAYFMKVKHAIA